VGSALSDVGKGDVGFLLDDSRSKFKVSHANVTQRMGLGHQSVTQILGEWSAPEVGRCIMVELEDDAAHALLAGIVSTGDRRREFHEFQETGWPGSQVVFEPLKVGESVMNSSIESDPGFVLKGQLELAEESTGSRQGNGHGPEFAENLVPFFGSCSVLRAGDGIEDFLEPLATVQR
jgi:hypothetical protein